MDEDEKRAKIAEYGNLPHMQEQMEDLHRARAGYGQPWNVKTRQYRENYDKIDWTKRD